jgi:ribosomal protein S18 acetylase RimI-like enzyme
MAAKTFRPVTSVPCSFVEPKSALKSTTVKINEVPTSFRLLKQTHVAAEPVLADGMRIVQAAEYKQAAACLAEAFGEDDVARYFIDVPDREHWTAEEKWALHVEILEYITYAHILKGLVTAVGDFEAVALWMPPGQNMDDYLTIFRSGMWRLNYRLSQEGKRRFFDEFLPLLHDTMHTTLGDREHEAWYLVYIGTRPSGRGKGHARKLIEHVTHMADRDGRACYLESSNACNPPIYRRFGFEACRTIQLQRGGRNIPLDIMVREPVTVGKKKGGK